MPQNTLGNPRLRMAVHLALTGGTLAASVGVSNAQEAPKTAANTSETSLEEVVVTGSRISAPNALSISPVTFVSAVEIEQTGVTRVEDLLNQLPQVFADQGSNVSNGSNGTATVNLRGLEAKRTLVLVDGFRLGYGDPRSGGAGSDINQVPTALIDSIEVLTGGASSVYGADAVAGVVNFKLNDHFEGVKLVADGGFYSAHNNNTQNVQGDLAYYNTGTGNSFAAAPNDVNPGTQKQLTFIAGLNSPDGNGNATVYATYRNIAAVLQSKYSVSACTFASGYNGQSSAGQQSGQFGCSGSSTSYPGRFLKVTGGTTTSDSTLGPGGTLVPFTDGARYNYGPLNYYQRPDIEYTSGAFLHYEFNEHATVYSQTMFMDDRTVAQIAPSGAFFGNPYVANCANPYLSASELAAWCGGSTAGTTNTGGLAGTGNSLYIGRRNVEGGPRQDDIEHTDWREVIGLRGKINDVWDYDASYQYGIVNLADTYYNDVSTTKINYALDVIAGPNGPECAVTATNPTSGLGLGCVPWNIFTPGGATKAAANYIDTPGLQRGQIQQTVVDWNVTGDLGKYGIQLPTASSGLKINAGLEYRDVNSYNEPDEEFQNGDLAGQGGPQLPVSGVIVSREGFAEARMPLMEDMPFAKALDFETGYRYSRYSQGYNTNTYKFGVDWAPISDVRFRGTFDRAVRAPNIVELYTTQSVGLDGNTDPCAGALVNGTVNGNTLATCARTGVTPAEFGHILPNSASQYNGLTGGNPNLKPETALTTAIGIQLTPSFIPNFRANIDYYDIKIENVIETIGADTILKECIASDLFCDLVHRSSIGSLWIGNTGYVTDSLANVGELEEKGVDIDVAYSVDIGKLGKLHFGVTGTYLSEYEVTPIAQNGGTAYNCAGLYGLACSSTTAGAGTPVFHWRDTFRTTWSTPWQGLDVSLAWRYYSAVKLEQLSANPNLAATGGATIANGGISNTDAFLPSVTYIDLTASMKVTDKVSVRLGVNNVLDRAPPVIGTTNLPSTSGNGNTFPGTYDALGRYIFGEVIAQF
ncbi:MAG: TonB-dependent receptor domain-containing protein [Steroidobacteraceae bacterium]